MKREKYNKWGQKLIASFLALMMILTTVFTNNVVSMAATSFIALSSKSETIAVGKSIQLKVKSVKGLKSKSVTWKSSNSKVAKVNSKGKVTGVTQGNAKITATSKSNKKVKATCKITVKKDAVQSIQLDKTACVIVKGKSAKVKVMGVEPSTASSKVTWKINKSSIGKVTVKGNTATIKGKKAGKATLTAVATDGSKKTAKVDIVVVNKKTDIKKVSEVKVSLKQEEIFAGETTTAQAVVSPKQATLKKVFWSVDNTEIAEIDQTGKITGLKAEIVKITARSQDGSGKKATVTLTVKDKSQSTVSPTKAPEGTETPTEIWCESIEDAGKVVREEMKKRSETIKLNYKTRETISDGSMLNEIVEKALIHTGVSTEGDYLKWQMADWKATVEGIMENNVNYLTITYSMNYYTNNEQEAEVDFRIATLKEQLNFQEKNDYEKIKAIYDYICSNVTYDYKNLNDDSYKLKYTAYAALVNGNTVCQGYANLLYRLLLEAGIDCRIITGISNGEAHAWNIVKLNDKYYYLNSTWDAQREKYSYFLKGNTDFDSHTSNGEYTTEEFQKTYPIAASKYVASSTDNGVIEIRTEKDLMEVANNPAGKYIMVNDIELSATEWEGLGDFQGEFDGNGHKITNLTSTKGKGLFANLLEQAVVKNLTIEGNILTEEQPAALMALTSQGKIINCVTKGSVKQISGNKGQSLSGMVFDNLGDMQKCRNEAEVYGVSKDMIEDYCSIYTGGVVVYNSGNMTECENVAVITSKSMYTGGIAGGNNAKAVINKCINTGKIVGTSACNGVMLAVGGIIGDNLGEVSECVNHGEVTTTSQINDYNVGGVVGMNSGYSKITGCENTGNVSGAVGEIAGICGEVNLRLGTFDENGNFETNDGDSVVSNCKNYGAITGNSVEDRNTHVGGVVGGIGSAEGKAVVKNCINEGEILGTGLTINCGGVVGLIFLEEEGYVELTKLMNKGKVIAEWDKDSFLGYSRAGGIFSDVATNSQTKGMAKISGCVNVGEVDGRNCSGIGTFGRAKMEKCYNLGNLTGHGVCGITGAVSEQSEVYCCYNLGTLTGQYAFGIAASLATDSYMSQVYNVGKIKGMEGEYAIIGRINEVEIKQEEEKKTEKLYVTIDKVSVDGTLTLQTRENLSACYYLAQDFITANKYGTALDSTVIEQQESYEGFDFDNVWEMTEQGGRKLPYLKVFDEIAADDFS